MDLKDAFWQVPLTEESAPLTTFNTPFGRYCFKRMPFGICSASEVLQKIVYMTFGDLPDVHVIADDLIKDPTPKRKLTKPSASCSREPEKSM